MVDISPVQGDDISSPEVDVRVAVRFIGVQDAVDPDVGSDAVRLRRHLQVAALGQLGLVRHAESDGVLDQAVVQFVAG